MTKAELIRAIAADTGLRQQDVNNVLGSLARYVEEAAARDETVKLPGFGSFKAKNMPERMGRNPRTGEAVPIPATRRLVFKASKKNLGT